MDESVIDAANLDSPSVSAPIMCLERLAKPTSSMAQILWAVMGLHIKAVKEAEDFISYKAALSDALDGLCPDMQGGPGLGAVFEDYLEALARDETCLMALCDGLEGFADQIKTRFKYYAETHAARSDFLAEQDG